MRRPHYTCGICLRAETRLLRGPHVTTQTQLISQLMYVYIIKPCFCFLTCHSVFVPDKSLKDTLDKVLLSGYFDRAQTHQNGTCVEEEEQEEPTVVAESKAVTQTSEPGNTLADMFVRYFFDPVRKLSSQLLLFSRRNRY